MSEDARIQEFHNLVLHPSSNQHNLDRSYLGAREQRNPAKQQTIHHL